MRILVLTNLYPPHYVGGYELRCRDITEALQERGHEVRVLTSNHKVEGVEEAPLQGYGVLRKLRLHGFFGHPWLGIRDLQALELHNNTALMEAVSAFKPDLVHVWNLGGISKSLTLTLQRLNLPTVYDVSDHWIARSLKADVWLDWWNRKTSNMVAGLARSVYSAFGARRRLRRRAPTNPLRHIRFQRVYFCSNRLREITMAAGYDTSHGKVIHCPVDTRRYLGKVKPTGNPVKKLLYAGRLSEDKGILTALQAMRVINGRSDAELHVYGRGDPLYETMLRGYATSHRLPVSFHSAKPEEMPEVYRQHDALLFTSEWEEPFALTPLEAMASGMPVIGTTTGGSAELFRHGVNALTYRAGDPHDLALEILHLQNSEVQRVRMAQAGQEEVNRRLTLPVITDQIETYLNESLATWQSMALPAHDEP